MKRIGRLILLLAFSPFALGDVYVDPAAGNDASSGQSGQPVRTLGRAAQLMAEQKGTIYLLAGVHSGGLKEVYLPPGVSLKGAGSASTTLSRFVHFRNRMETVAVEGLTVSDGWIAIEYCIDAEIKNCEFNNSGSSTAYSIIVKNTDVLFSNCEFDRKLTYNYTGKCEGTGNLTFDSCTFKYTAHDPSVGYERIFSVLGCNDFTLRNSTLSGAGMDIEKAVNVLITGNTFTLDSAAVFIDRCQDLVVQSNFFDSLAGAYVTISASWAETATISGNRLEGGSMGVSGGGGPGTAIASGNTCINGGSIYGNMTISGNSFSGGQCGGDYAIVENNTFVDARVSVPNGIVRNNGFDNSYLHAYRGLVQGNTFSNVTASIAIMSGENAVVAGNTIQGNGTTAIQYAGTVKNNDIRGFENGIYRCRIAVNNTIECTKNGIETASEAASEVRIEDNMISGGTGTGIVLNFAPALVCRGNTIEGPFGWGISGGGSSSSACELTNNTIRNCINGISGNPVGCTIIGANRQGTGVSGSPVNCRISGFDKGVVGAASQCDISDCNIGAYRYSAIDCTITGCDTGFQRDSGYSWLNSMLFDSTVRNCGLGADYASGCDIVSCVTGALVPVSCNISGCSVGAVQPSECIITGCQTGVTGPANDNYVVTCQIGMQNTGSRNIIEGCDVGTRNISGGQNVFIGNKIALEGERSRTFGGTGYNLFQANTIAIKGVTGGTGAEKHNDFIGNGVAVLAEAWNPTPGSKTSLSYSRNYWNSPSGPTINSGPSHGDLIQFADTHYSLGYYPYDTAPNVTDPIEYPGGIAGEGVLRGELTITPVKGASPVTVSARCDAMGGVPPYRYAWIVDGANAESDSSSLSRTFDQEGAHTIEVVIVDGEYTVARAAGSVTVSDVYAEGSLTVMVQHEGSPLEGATVDVSRSGSGVIAAGVTGGSGQWSSGSIGVGYVTVTVDAPGVEAMRKSVRISKNNNASLAFNMKTLHAFEKKREVIANLKAFPRDISTKPLAAVETQAEIYLNSGPEQETVMRLGLAELAAWSACGEAEMLSTGIASSLGEVLGSIIEALNVSAKLRAKALDKLPVSLKTRAEDLLKSVDGKLTGIFGEFVRFAASSAPGAAGEKLRQDLQSAAAEWIDKKSSENAGELLAEKIRASMLLTFGGQMESALEQGLTEAKAGQFGNTLSQAQADLRVHMSAVREDSVTLANQLANTASLKGLATGFQKSAELAGSLLTYTGVGTTFQPWVKAVENVSSALSTAADGWQVGAGAYRIFGELPEAVMEANRIAFGRSAKMILQEDFLLATRTQSALASSEWVSSASAYRQAWETFIARLNAGQADSASAWLDQGLLPADAALSREFMTASAGIAALMTDPALSAEDLDTLQSLSGRMTAMGVVQGLVLLQALSMVENLTLYQSGGYPGFPQEKSEFFQSVRNIAGEIEALAFERDALFARLGLASGMVAWGRIETNPTVITATPLDVEVIAEIVNLSNSAVSAFDADLSLRSDTLALLTPAKVSISTLAAKGQAGDSQECRWTMRYTGSVIGGGAVALLSVSGLEEVEMPSPVLVFLTAPSEQDTDLDGLPDDYENANSLNANDAGDASQDHDFDGLTALEEYFAGTRLDMDDTDGDDLTDGEEVKTWQTDPLLVDTDGGGVWDRVEVVFGLDPNWDGDDATLAAPQPTSVAPTPTPDPGPPVTIAFRGDQPDFSPYIFYSPTGLVGGDLSGDGDQDVLVLSDYRYQKVLLNQGGGSFNVLEMKGYNLEWSPLYKDVCIGNVDSDAEPELVGILSEGKVVWQNVTETPSPTYNVPTVIQDITTGLKARVLNANGDSWNDLLVGYTSPQQGLTVRLLTGASNGSFTDNTENLFTTTAQLATLGAPYGFTVIDADGDGRDDLFLGDTDEGQFYRYNIQLGKFEPGNTLFSDGLTGVRVREAYGGDFNLDGLNDLLILYSVTDYYLANKKIRLYLGKAGGGWQLSQASVLGDYDGRQLRSTGGLALADLDRDGDLDVVAFNCYDTLTRILVLNNNTRGAFEPDDTYVDQPSGLFSDVTWRVQGLAVYQSGIPGGLLVDDFNGDGAPDLLLAHSLEGMVLLYNETPAEQEPWKKVFSFSADWGREARVGPKVESDYNSSGQVEAGDAVTLIRSHRRR